MEKTAVKKRAPAKRVNIREEICKGCKLCVYYCPDKALDVQETFNAKGCHPVKWKGPCSLCGRCYIICPHGAVEISE